MSKNSTKALVELLNQEKWTRATLNSYTIHNFKELDVMLEESTADEERTEIKNICEEHLTHTKNSIIALYLSGIISLTQQLVDDTNLIILINIFTDNHKWNIVEFLCKRILDYGENKYALRTLSDCYENNNEEDKKYDIWERLIKVDYEEAEIVKLLAERKEAQGNTEEAISYYKKAIYRFINKKSFSKVKEIWTKLIEFSPDDIDFFFHIEQKIAKALNTERSSLLLHTLLPYFKKHKKWDITIKILKKILKYNSKDAIARKEIVDCYKNKYKDHSQLKEYIKLSNLNQSWRNIHDAISDFEKHISFDTGNYVFHRTWGIGKITNIQDDVFIIDFTNKSNHQMSLKMAVNALKILDNEHIWVLKATMPKDELKSKIINEIPWALKIIIKSFDNVGEMKKIKMELVPDLLSTNEWTKWNVEARKVLKTDSTFGNLPDRLDRFEVRDKPISFEEKTFNTFKAEKQFYQRVQTILDFIKHSEPDSDYFGEMFSYFVGFCKSFTNVTEFVISSFILIQRIITMYPFLNPSFSFNFKDLFNQIEDVEGTFSKISDAELKKDFLMNIKRFIPNWPDYFIRLFKLYQSKFIIEELLANDKKEKISELFSNLLDHYKEYREPFLWFPRNVITEPWFQEFGIQPEKILICIVHLLDITYREISNRRNASLNRKLNKQILDFLFKSGNLQDYIMQAADEDAIIRIYTLVDDVKELDPSLKVQMRHIIKSKYPDFQFITDEGVEVEKTKRRILVIKDSYEKKQKDLRHLIEVEVPRNSKEIGVAMAKGDLRENAEYKAALEKQDLLNSTHAKLQDELQNVKIFDPSQVNTDMVSFGTKVKILNKVSSELEEYTILGPWESDPSNNIISYLSPLGAELCNNKVGDELNFVINENHFNYIIEGIEKAI